MVPPALLETSLRPLPFAPCFESPSGKGCLGHWDACRGGECCLGSQGGGDPASPFPPGSWRSRSATQQSPSAHRPAWRGASLASHHEAREGGLSLPASQGERPGPRGSSSRPSPRLAVPSPPPARLACRRVLSFQNVSVCCFSPWPRRSESGAASGRKRLPWHGALRRARRSRPFPLAWIVLQLYAKAASRDWHVPGRGAERPLCRDCAPPGPPHLISPT